MKNVLFFVFGWSLLWSFAASAGPLYGTVKMGRDPAVGVKLLVACPGFNRPTQTAEGMTDPRGGFSLRVQATGRCEMKVQRNNQVGVPFEVFVSNNPLKFDFELDGSLNKMR